MLAQSKAFYADLFSKGPPPRIRPSPAPDPAPVTAPAPTPAPEHRALVSVTATPIKRVDALPPPGTAAQSIGLSSGLRKLIGNVDAHNLSPREMANLSQNLYAAGVISFDEYSLLAFQPELHPDFDRTIGALTGEVAAPDQQRDFVHIWQERADFQRRHNAGRPDLIEKTEHIAAVLNRIEAPNHAAV